MHEILEATPYNPGELGSLGRAQYMLMAQHQFPVKEYDHPLDIMVTADHDRCVMWDYDHAQACCSRFTGRGDMGIGEWCRTANSTDIFDFWVAILKVEQSHPDRKWTGYRVLGTVNRSNGYPVWSLQLFSKGSQVEVCNRPAFKGYNKNVIWG